VGSRNKYFFVRRKWDFSPAKTLCNRRG
jgi:hypothetical protein